MQIFFSGANSAKWARADGNRQIQFGQSHHHFGYQCTVSQRNYFRISVRFTSWKSFSCHVPCQKRENCYEGHTHTHFFLTRERLHKSLNTCITTWFVGLPLLHCPAEHAAHYVHIETIRFYGCGSVWRTFEAITAMLQVYICMNESASPSIINMRIEESVHCVESVYKHAKQWTHCTLQNGGTLHPKIWWCMTWRIFFFCLFV